MRASSIDFDFNIQLRVIAITYLLRFAHHLLDEPCAMVVYGVGFLEIYHIYFYTLTEL